MKRVALYVLTTCALIGLLDQRRIHSQINTTKELAPGVYFHEGDLRGKGHCNNGWVVFEDYVLVIDANFPSGAREIIPKIRALTNKPIRGVPSARQIVALVRPDVAERLAVRTVLEVLVARAARLEQTYGGPSRGGGGSSDVGA